MWQVEFPKGWWNIDVSVQETIQLAYESGSPTVVFAILQSSRHDLWRHYEIVFSCMNRHYFIADNAVCNGVASWKGPTAMQMEMRVQIVKRPMREETGSKSCSNSSLTLT